VRYGSVATEARGLLQEAYQRVPAAQSVDVVEKGYAVTEAQ
jgi:hypothetical protein